jgi:anti-sigma-K factor RskA
VTTTDIHALVGAYALDAVDDLERAAFERHVAECETCRLEVTELRETAARLADSTWSVPPPRLRTEVMATIGRTRQLPPPGDPTGRGQQTRGAGRWRRFAVGAVAAGVLAAGASTGVWAVQVQRVRDADAVAAAARLQEERTRSVLSATDLVVRTAPMIGGGRVTVASSASQGASVVSMRADRLSTASQAFQMWTIRDGEKPVPVPAGVLPAGQEAAVRVVDGVPGNDVFAISLEPAGGSPQPTDVVAKVYLT